MNAGGSVNSFMTILTIGAVGAIIYTLVKNPQGVKALMDGVDNLLTASYKASLGKV